MNGQAAAQVPAPAPAAVIRVVGHGEALTPPDLATITFTVRGEGATPDDAVRALVAKRTAIDAALAGAARVTTGKLSVRAARDRACEGDDDDRTRLSTGACAVKGHVATVGVTAKVAAVTDAGTLLGLASRLGAVDATLEDFALAHPDAARRAAIGDAMRDAREQAAAIAAAARVTLGPVRRVEDERAGQESVGQDVIVSGLRAPAVVSPPPIAVALAPEPVRSEASLIVEFAVGAPLP